MPLSTVRNSPASGLAGRRPAYVTSLRLLVGLTLLVVAFYPLRGSAQIVFAEDFDGMPGPTAGGAGTYVFPAGWTLVNRDNRTPAGAVAYVNQAWERREDFSFSVVDSAAFSTSWYTPAGAADDWMISPLIGSLPANTELRWNAVAYDPMFRDGYEVRLSTTVATAAACEAGPQLFTIAAELTTWTARNASLAAHAGQNVYVCFHNNSDDKFLLLIDDIVVEAIVNFDAQIVSTALPSAYTQIPLSQTRPLTLSGTVRNNGISALTNVTVTAAITRDGTEFYQQSSTPIASLAPAASAAFTITGYAPDSVGVYEIAYEVASDQTDQVPANNTATRSQEISETVFARDDGTLVGQLGIGAGNGGILGQTFGLVTPDVLRSVTFTLTDPALYIGQEIRVEIYDVPASVTRASASPDATRAETGSPVRGTDEIEPLALATYTPSSQAGPGGAAHRLPPGDPPTTLLGRTVALVITPADTLALTYTLPIEGGPLALDAGDFYLGVVEPDSTLTLGQTNNLFTEGTTWVDWPTNPFGTWANNEDFGASFAKTYALRANLDAGVTQELVGAEGWRELASPSPTTVGAFLDSLWTQGFPGADYAGGGCNVYVFDETVGSRVEGWTCVTNATDPLGPGDGLLVYVFEDDDYNLPGVQGGFPKTLPTPVSGGTVPFSDFGLTYTNGPETPADAEGWNLIGNPLESAFDWDAAELSPGLSEAVYIYDPSYLGGDYRVWSQDVGGDLPDGVVPQNQGFFVQGISAGDFARGGGPILTIPEAAVVDSDPPVYSRTAAPDPLRLALAVLGDDGTATPVSVTFVAAADGAATGNDASDAIRLTPMAWPRTVLATTSADGTPLAINVLPSDAAYPVELPLRVTAAGWPAGPLALDLTWTGALPEGWTAVLLDQLAGTETPLDVGGRYRFSLDVPEADGARPGAGDLPTSPLDSAPDAASTRSRFALRIVPAGFVGVEGSVPVVFGLDSPAPNPVSGAVTLGYAIPAAGEVSLVVYDALGREVAVLVEGTVEAGRHAVAFAGASLPSGVYLVGPSAGGETQTRRFTLLR